MVKTILSEALNGNVQRLFRKEVHSSEWKRGTLSKLIIIVLDNDDIVSSAWKHVAAGNAANKN